MVVMYRALGRMVSTRASIGGTNGFKSARLPTLNGASEKQRTWRNCRFIIVEMICRLFKKCCTLSIGWTEKTLRNLDEYIKIC